MNYVRMIMFSLLGGIGFWITSSNVHKALGAPMQVIEVSGILNVWAGFGCLLIGMYMVIWSVKEQFQLHLKIGNINTVLLVTSIIIAPLLAATTYGQIQANISGYVECKGKREVRSRYSSRTYAISEELCVQSN